MRQGRRLLILLVVWLLGSTLPFAQQTGQRSNRTSPLARRGFQVEIKEPVEGGIVQGPTRIRVEMTTEKPEDVLEVIISVDDEVVFVDREAPFQVVHDFGPDPRSAVIRAVATHAAGFKVEHAVVTRALKLSYSLEVRRVVLTLSVVDDNGKPVLGLQKDQFAVSEDGERQEIIHFAVEERPLRIGLVLDTSGSMRERLPQVQMAANTFLDVLRPEDRAMVVDFDDQVLLLQGLTDNREHLRSALMSTFARGGTAMYDAVHAALRRLAPADERKAIVLLSDGGDTASVMDKDMAKEAARTSEVLIYAIGLGGADKSVLKSMADETGGRAFFAGQASELGAVYERIAAELRNQYIISYSSTRPEYDGKWRKVKVDYTGGGSYKVKTRKGYYAVRSGQSPLDVPVLTPPPEDPEGAP